MIGVESPLNCFSLLNCNISGFFSIPYVETVWIYCTNVRWEISIFNRKTSFSYMYHHHYLPTYPLRSRRSIRSIPLVHLKMYWNIPIRFKTNTLFVISQCFNFVPVSSLLVSRLISLEAKKDCYIKKYQFSREKHPYPTTTTSSFKMYWNIPIRFKTNTLFVICQCFKFAPVSSLLVSRLISLEANKDCYNKDCYMHATPTDLIYWRYTIATRSA